MPKSNKDLAHCPVCNEEHPQNTVKQHLQAQGPHHARLALQRNEFRRHRYKQSACREDPTTSHSFSANFAHSLMNLNKTNASNDIIMENAANSNEPIHGTWVFLLDVSNSY